MMHTPIRSLTMTVDVHQDNRLTIPAQGLHYIYFLCMFIVNLDQYKLLLFFRHISESLDLPGALL